MERMTKRGADGAYRVDASDIAPCADGFAGAAVERLAAYEDALELVEAQLASVTRKLDDCKANGRVRSASAQQLLAQKVTYSTMLNTMDPARFARD